MAQTYNLDEAAQKLGLTPQDLKRRLRSEWTHVQPMIGGGTMHFRASDVEELARRLGLSSDPDLQLAPPAGSAKPAAVGDEPLILNFDDEPAAPRSGSGLRAKTPATPTPTPADDPLMFDDGGDAFSLLPDEPKSAPPVKPGKPDSDVSLKRPGSRPGPGAAQPTEEITLELDDSSGLVKPSPSGILMKGPASGILKPGGSGVLKGPGSGVNLGSKPPSSAGGSAKRPGSNPNESSEFELSLDDEEIEIGKMPPRRAGDSGIGIHKPADSGISLEKGASDEIDFELSLDAESTSKPSLGGPKTGPKTGKLPPASAGPNESSEFELSLDEGSVSDATTAYKPAGGDKDIFETDFNIPALDDESGSEAIALNDADTDLESSEFDLDLSASTEEESGSAVVALDDEEEETPKPRRRSGAAIETEDLVDFDEVETGDTASSALREMAGDRSDEDAELLDEDDEVAAAPAVAAAWGPLPALALMPAVVVMFVAGLMAWETLRSYWGYQQPYKPAGMIVKSVAGMVDDQIAKE